MSARVITQTSYYTWCADCGWGIVGFDDDDDAAGVVDTHNRQNHPTEGNQPA